MMLLRLGVGSASLHAMQETEYAGYAGCGRQDAAAATNEAATPRPRQCYHAARYSGS